MKVHKSAERELGKEQPSAPLLTNAKHPVWTNLQEGCDLLSRRSFTATTQILTKYIYLISRQIYLMTQF